MVIPAFLHKEPWNPHINTITEEQSSESVICVCINYWRWEKCLNTSDGRWMSDPTFEETNFSRVLFCHVKFPSPGKVLVWKRKLPGSSKGVSWFPAGNSRCPRYYCCCSVHMLISPKARPGPLFSLPLLEGKRLNYFHARCARSCMLKPSHCKALIPLPFKPPISLEFLQKRCSPSRPKDVQRCHNSSSPGHTIYSHHLVHNLPFIFSSVSAPSLSFPLPSSLLLSGFKMRHIYLKGKIKRRKSGEKYLSCSKIFLLNPIWTPPNGSGALVQRSCHDHQDFVINLSLGEVQKNLEAVVFICLFIFPRDKVGMQGG